LRKSKKIIIVSIALIAIILSFVGGQVYAKYMSKVNGKGTADIAQWSFKVNENEEKLQTISLKSTINNQTLVNNKIAPGTEGSFQIKIDATGSDVGINYVTSIQNESAKPTNLKFAYNNNTYNTLTELQEVLKGTINADDQNKIKTITIDWYWSYETGSTPEQKSENDIIDTKNAKEISEYTFDIIITGTQVDPRVQA
jgi:hypothetical protein